jgi:hypothetical protein
VSQLDRNQRTTTCNPPALLQTIAVPAWQYPFAIDSIANANPGMPAFVRNIGPIINLYAYFNIPLLVFSLTIPNQCFITILFQRYVQKCYIKDNF